MVLTLDQAIAREEGFYVTGSRAQRNNNPGNIEYGAFSRAFGATNGDPRFAVFPSVETGFNCLQTLIRNHYGTMTLAAMMNMYAPPTENDTAQYVRNLCAWCECQPTTIVNTLLPLAETS